MTPIKRTLLAIAAFLALAVGTFVYFIANWDASKTQSIGQLDSPAHLTFLIQQRSLGAAFGSHYTMSVRT